VCRRTVPGELHSGAQGEAAVGLELDRPAAEGLDALQDAQGAWAKVFHEQIIGGGFGRQARRAGASGHTGLLQNLDKSVAHLLQVVFRESEPVKDHVHAAEGTAQSGRDEVSVHFDGSVSALTCFERERLALPMLRYAAAVQSQLQHLPGWVARGMRDLGPRKQDVMLEV
jgi:hypothetical protein